MQASLNLHVGNEMLVIEKDKEPQYTASPSFTSKVLPPMALAIVKSREFICMPPFLVALLVSPVRTAINGISNISTMIDPNFEGFLLLNFANLSPWDLQITPDDLVCRAVFHMVAQVSRLREFTEYAPKYQATHEQHLLLRDIIDFRVKDMKHTVHSPTLQEKLQKWIAAEKTE
jgi:deoxycytidine triphosphate deaminase